MTAHLATLGHVGTQFGTALLLPSWMNPEHLLQTFGTYALWGTLVVVFIECGLLFPILPGDSLLFAVGLFVADRTIHQPLWLCLLLIAIAAFAGNVAGYFLGRAVGTALFRNPNARIFKPSHLDRTNAFFDRYGARALVLGRFVPIVRTYITLVAGAARMDKRRFFVWTGVGAVLWTLVVTMLGYWLGGVSFIRNNIEIALILIAVISVLPMVVEYLRARRGRSPADAAVDAATGTADPENASGESVREVSDRP